MEISSLIDEPEFDEAELVLVNSAAKGIRVADTERVKSQCNQDASLRKEHILSKWGIDMSNVYTDTMGLLYKSKEPYRDTVVTSRADIKKLAVLGYEPALDILSYFKVMDCYSKANTLGKAIDQSTSRVYPEVTRGITNRLSYKNPPLISYSNMNLEMMIRPRNIGDRLVSVDIKSEEPWILFNSLDVIEIKSRLDRNNHSSLYEMIYEYTGNKIKTPAERKQVKRAVIGTLYGMGDSTLKKEIIGVDGVAIKKVIYSFPEIKQFIGESREQIKEGDTVIRTYFDTPIKVSRSELTLPKILNYTVQGTAADILAILITHINAKIYNMGLENDIEIYYARYDELILNISREYLSKHTEGEIIDTLKKMFLIGIDDWEPFGYDIEFIKERDSVGNEILNEDIIEL